jgi:hypothetical protein
MGMTIGRLHKLLGAMVETGHGRRSVCVDKPSFQHNCESDGCVILEVEGGAIRTYNRIADDGGLALKANGEERMITGLVLHGDMGSSFDGEGDDRKA